MNKNKVRSEVLHRRGNIDISEVEQKSQIIRNKLYDINIFKEASDIMLYLSIKNEVETRPLMERCWALGKRVYVPICNTVEKTLVVSRLDDYEKELVLGAMGILEPRTEYVRKTNPLMLDIIITPGVAFDKKCNRIGFGGGYYDTFFCNEGMEKIIKLAVAYEFQVFNQIPILEYDIPVDILITEQNIYFK